MLKRYNIWDRVTNVITPVGEIMTPEKWIERHPMTNVPGLTPVVSAGPINGGFVGVLEQMVQMAENSGCDFSDCTTAEEKLERIEQFEDERNTPDPNYVSDETRIADSLQDLVVLNMPAE